MRRQRQDPNEAYDLFGDINMRPKNAANAAENNNSSSSGYQNNNKQHQATSRGSAGGISHNVGTIDWSTIPKTVRNNFIEKALLKEKKQSAAPTAASMSSEIQLQKKWRDEKKITIHGISDEEQSSEKYLHVLKPMTDLASLKKVHSRVYEAFAKLGFAAPTPIQAQAWPLLFAGKDVIGIAKTGSGKTLAFAVPAVAHALAQQTAPLARGEGPLVLVLAPTRELALQIDVEARKLFSAMKETNSANPTMRSLCIFGGVERGVQLASLQASPTFVVATPGRLLDLLNTRTVGLKRVVYLVLDEADRMLDMGFEPQIRDVLSFVRTDRQTLMFSATWPQEVQKLAMDFTSKEEPAIRVQVGSDELQANADVRQHIMFLKADAEKFQSLKLLLNRFPKKRILVFVKKRVDADDLERKLNASASKAYAFHGDKEQSERMDVLATFRKTTAGGILVATDVASRGLDIQELDVVVNYDFPMTLEDYVHRIGRTGRAGATGDAFSFITKREEQLNPWVAQELVSLLEDVKQQVPNELRLWAADTLGQPKPGTHGANNSNHNGGGERRVRYTMANQLKYTGGNKPTELLAKKKRGLDLGDLLGESSGKKGSGNPGGAGMFGKRQSFDPFA